ncbi:TRAP transporter substrate-binding protein DctP, partial [Escherichia coli]|nr:TRAP transporter substrate-binding protein DctP [Escherichia coli]
HYYKVTDGGVGREILNSSADSGCIGVTYYDAGARSFYTNKPINTPEDLKGLKVRVQPSPSAIAMVKALGGNPTPLAYGELYTAL